nr:hypothetical protein [Halomonas azerica]
MKFMVASVFMPNPENVVGVTVKARECDCFEAVHDIALLLRRDRLARSKRQDTTLVLVFETQGVNEPLSRLWIAAQHRRRWVTRDCLFFA